MLRLKIQNKFIAFLQDTLVIAILYVLLAQIGYKMAMIGGIYPSVWPPAGLALVAMVQLGKRSTPGIWLGAFAATFIYYQPAARLPGDLCMMAVKASGVTLQVVACGWLINRWNQSHKDSSYLKHFGAYTLITAFTGTISPAVDAATLVAAGWISVDRLGILFIGGWVENWLSTLAFTPFFVTIGMWLKHKLVRYHPAMMVVSIGMIMSLFMFSMLRQDETEQIRSTFSTDANAVYTILDKTIQLGHYDLNNLAAFAANHEGITQSDFDAFVSFDRSGRQDMTGVRSLAWVPYITAGNRQFYEATMRWNGTKYDRVMERSAAGEMTPAAARADYYPVSLLGPQDTREIFEQGFDLGSIPAIRKALIEARDNNRFSFVLQADTTASNSQKEMVIFIRPVYRTNGPLETQAARQKDILGFVLGIYPVDDLVSAATASLATRGYDLSLLDLYVTTQDEQILSFHLSSTTPRSMPPETEPRFDSLQKDRLFYTNNLGLDGQTWQVLIKPAPGWEENLRSPIPWFSLEAGVVVTIFMVILLIYRQQAEQMKQENEERIQLAMENAEVNYWLYDGRKSLVTLSENLAETLGLPSEPIHNQRVIEQVALPEDLEQLRQIKRSVMQDGVFPYTELRAKLPNHEIIWLALFGKVNRDDSGKITHMIGGAQNITRRKRGEEELRASEERYRKLVEYSPDIISLEVDGKFVYINDPGLRLMGVEKMEDVLGRDLLDFVQPDYREIVNEWIKQLNRGQSIFSNLEIQIQRPDGTTVDTNMISVPISYMGKPGGLIISHDALGAKANQNFILDNKDNLQSYIDYAPMAIIIADLSGRFVAVNQAARALLGYAESELLSMHLMDLLTEEGIEKSASFVDSIRKSGYAKDEFEVRTCANESIWVSARVIIIEDNHLMAFLQDITEIRQAEHKLLYQAKLLANVRDAIIAVDEHSRVTAWNPAAEAIYGWSADEVLGCNVDEVLNTGFVGATPGDLDRSIAETDSFEGEVRQQHKNGAWLFIECHVRGIRGSKGQLTGMVTVNRDITIRKQAVNELKDQKEILQKIFDHIPLMITLIAPDGGMKLVNREWQSTMGITQAEIQDQNIAYLFHEIFPDSAERRMAFSDLTFPTQKWRDLVSRTRSGRILDTSWITIKLTDGTNIAIGQDVTELRKVERIEKIHARVSSILASSPKLFDALAQVMETIGTQLKWQVAELWWFNPESKHIQWKAGWHEAAPQFEAFERTCRLTQYAKGEGLPGIAWGEGIGLWYEDYSQEPISGCPLRIEAAGLHAAIAMPIIDNEHVFGIITFMNNAACPFDQQLFDMLSDISRQTGQFVARNQAEQTLAQAEEGYRMLFEEAPVIYMISRNEPGGPILGDCNNLFLSAMGYTRDEVLGRPIADLLSPQSREAFLNRGHHLALDGKLGPEEQDLMARDGKIIQGILYTVPDKDRDGKVIGARSIHVDISERKRMEQDLQNERAMLARRVEERTAELSVLNARLLQASRAKDEFLANMSHELRTPLNGILAFSETLLEETRGPLNERQQRAVRNIETSGMHLLALINDILDLSKIEAGKLDIQMETIWVNEVCQASLVFIKETANRKHIRVEYHCDQPDLRLQSDPRRLKQILVNLLSNAVKFTPEGGEVHLSVEPDPAAEVMRISVCDTGIGISPADQQRLFRPFVQIDSSLTRQQEGTGLGLALVRRLMELHGGSVSLESEVGQGSCFTVCLPWADPRQAAGEEKQTVSYEAAKRLEKIPGGKKVLLAEDNELNIEAVGEYLKDCGFDLRIARNGKEALAYSQEFQPDLILMDIQMPIMDGLQAIRKLRDNALFQQTPIIAMTALVMSGDRERCLQAGANEYIGKPVNLRSLVQTIERLLGIHA